MRITAPLMGLFFIIILAAIGCAAVSPASPASPSAQPSITPVVQSPEEASAAIITSTPNVSPSPTTTLTPTITFTRIPTPSPIPSPSIVVTPTPIPTPTVSKELEQKELLYTKIKQKYPGAGIPINVSFEKWGGDLSIVELNNEALTAVWQQSNVKYTSYNTQSKEDVYYSVFVGENSNILDVSSLPASDFPSPMDQGIGQANFKGMFVYGDILYKVTGITEDTANSKMVPISSSSPTTGNSSGIGITIYKKVVPYIVTWQEIPLD